MNETLVEQHQKDYIENVIKAFKKCPSCQKAGCS